MYTDTTDTNPIIDSVYFLVLDYRPFLSLYTAYKKWLFEVCKSFISLFCCM